jgi:hypothetical protein
MSKKLAKIATGLGIAVSTFYWGALPALAAGSIDLCNNASGVNVVGLCNVSLGGVVKTALNTVLFVAFVAALIFLIIGGIKWIMSGGDKEGANKAKETVTSALIGLVVVLGSWVLINVILNFFGASGGLSSLNLPNLQP